MREDKELEEFISDALIGRAHCFSVGERRFFLYPVTYGKRLLLKRLVSNLGIDPDNITADVFMETIRVVKEKKDDCLRIISYHTCKTKEEVFDHYGVQEKVDFFRDNLSEEEIATLMVTVLTTDRTQQFIKYFGIDKDQDCQRIIARAKGDKNSIILGGKSPFGSLIDTACERYGWTKDYVVWGIDLQSLQMMLADKIQSIYLTEEERKKMPASVRNANENIIKPTKENMQEIMAMDWR